MPPKFIPDIERALTAVGELLAAADWVRAQDPSPEFAQVVAQVVDHAERHAR